MAFLAKQLHVARGDNKALRRSNQETNKNKESEGRQRSEGGGVFFDARKEMEEDNEQQGKDGSQD